MVNSRDAAKPALVATKSSRNVTLKVKPSELFKAIGKGAISFWMGSAPGALAELPDIAAAIGLNSTPEDRVWVLALRSLERALTFLVEELFTPEEAQSLDIHAASFEGLNDNLVLELRPDFLERPERSKLVSRVREDAVRWLTAIGVDPIASRNIASRLDGVFSRSLHDEWRSNSAYYEPILTALKSPFAIAAKSEQSWDRYRSYMISMRDERVFDESFSLSSVYVWPRAYYTTITKPTADAQFAPEEAERQIHHVLWLKDEILRWIKKCDSENSIKVISGGPGAGKSSFAKMLSADIAKTGGKILFVPLHLLEVESGVSTAISTYLKDADFFDESPLDDLSVDNPLILILDGLDELQMQGKASQEAAQSLVSDLCRLTDRVNSTSCKLLTIITGREIAVQGTESYFKAEGQVLHMVPYFVSEDTRKGYSDPKNILAQDQRDVWWALFGQVTGNGYDRIPKHLAEGDIGEVTSQPLLNYLVALSFIRGLSLDENTNVNTVYEDLLKAVYERGWSKNKHPSVREVTYESFVRLLEEVALAVWHGAGRTTTLSEVEEHCRQSKIGNLLPNFTSGVSAGVSTLLLAFYFRQKGRRADGEKTFEFTHKSFAEYLTSLRIVRAVDQIHKQYTANSADPDGGWDAETCLHKWLLVFGPTAIDTYLLAFVRREVLAHGAKTAAEWQRTGVALLEFSCKSSWPISFLQGLKQIECMRWMKNAEEALVACINACARVSSELSNPRWPSATYFGEMLKRLQGQRLGPTNKLVMECLSYWDLENQCLDMADLYAADLRRSNLQSSMLHYANLAQAKLDGVNFTRALFMHTDITGTSVQGTIFEAGQLAETYDGRHRVNAIHKPARAAQGEALDRVIQQYIRRGAEVIGHTLRRPRSGTKVSKSKQVKLAPE